MRVAILHGAGYTGGELIRLLVRHPEVDLGSVTSRTYAGHPVWSAHPALRGECDLVFVSPENVDLSRIDVVFVAAEHGQGAAAVQDLLRDRYAGRVVDLSADHRFKDPGIYPLRFGFEHPDPSLLDNFVYGLPEVVGDYPEDTRFVANPGCFATAISLALWPLVTNMPEVTANVTALTGASGSGTHPKTTTHFPTRDGNVRAYKVFAHQHQPEIEQTLGAGLRLAFVPVSGPWTRGIWGTALVELRPGIGGEEVDSSFRSAYEARPFIRLYPNALPELRFSVNTPYCDLGWQLDGRRLVVGFALDNLLKGAASQAVQNMNLMLGINESVGLIPSPVVGKRVPT